MCTMLSCCWWTNSRIILANNRILHQRCRISALISAVRGRTYNATVFVKLFQGSGVFRKPGKSWSLQFPGFSGKNVVQTSVLQFFSRGMWCFCWSVSTRPWCFLNLHQHPGVLLAAYWRVTPFPKDSVFDVFWEEILFNYISCKMY